MMIVPGKSSSDRQLWKRNFSLLYEPFSIFMYLSAFIFESLIVMGLENETSPLTPFSLIQLTKKATKGVPELHISWQKTEDCSKPHWYLNVAGFGIKSPSFMLPFPFLTFFVGVCWQWKLCPKHWCDSSVQSEELLFRESIPCHRPLRLS